MMFTWQYGGLPASQIYRIWKRLPNWLRDLISFNLSRIPISNPLLSWLATNPPSRGFVTMTPDTPLAVARCLQRIAQIGLIGDYYEFGLYRGYTFWYAQHSANQSKLDSMHFWGFDSFQGLPAPQGVDAETNEFHQGDYACSRKDVEHYLTQHDVDWSRTTLIEGFYDTSLVPEVKANYKMRPVAAALIDCDLYVSTVCVLDFLVNLLQEGSILLFDDWNCFEQSDQKGERRAFQEFLTKNPRWRAEPYIRFGWHGQAFILHQSQS